MGMLLIGYIIGQAQIFSPVRELHDATVVSRDADRIYTVSVAGHRQVIRLCAWGDELPLRSGMVMTLMQYKQQADCMLIDGDTYVSYLRDQNKNVVDSAGHILFAKEE